MQAINDESSLIRCEVSQSLINSMCEQIAQEDFIFLTSKDVRQK